MQYLIWDCIFTGIKNIYMLPKTLLGQKLNMDNRFDKSITSKINVLKLITMFLCKTVILVLKLPNDISRRCNIYNIFWNEPEKKKSITDR